jgi:hypothetical protein
MIYLDYIEAKPISQSITSIRTFSISLPSFHYLMPNLTVKSAASLVHNLEAWGSNLGKQTDHHVSKEWAIEAGLASLLLLRPVWPVSFY